MMRAATPRRAPVIVPRLFTRLLLLGACAGAGWLGGTAWNAHTAVRERAVPPIDESMFPSAGMAAGPAAGVPTLRIFGDYECSACRDLDERLGDSLLVLARTGRIRLVYHHSPLRVHPLGAQAGAVAYCAALHGHGWAVHRALYRMSPAWGRTDADRAGSSSLQRLLSTAARAGADSTAVRACVAAGRAEASVREDHALARLLRVRAVPTILADSARLEFRSFPALLGHITRLAS
jgi:protein-disulfide isomerase